MFGYERPPCPSLRRLGPRKLSVHLDAVFFQRRGHKYSTSAIRQVVRPPCRVCWPWFLFDSICDLHLLFRRRSMIRINPSLLETASDAKHILHQRPLRLQSPGLPLTCYLYIIGARGVKRRYEENDSPHLSLPRLTD